MMSFLGDLRNTPAATKPPAAEGGGRATDPLENLAAIKARVHALQKFLSHAVNGNTLIGKDQMEMVSAEISSAIHHTIVNGAALLASTQTKITPEIPHPKSQHPIENHISSTDSHFKMEKPKNGEDYEVIELDAVELLAEHVHFCEICGKGFKRDANLRMHMRAHGDRFKTLEALAKPAASDSEKYVDFGLRKTRFSCPFVGCNRNKHHKKFRPLKSVICVKNHFKRSHCPKMYCCTTCNKKSFSVLADLKSHLKHCGETKWKCSCGTNFSRKDKLFGHMALFEGHMPAVTAEVEEDAEEEEEEKGKGVAVAAATVVDDCVEMAEDYVVGGGPSSNSLTFEEFVDGFGTINDNYCFQDMFGSPNASDLVSGMDGFFNY